MLYFDLENWYNIYLTRQPLLQFQFDGNIYMRSLLLFFMDIPMIELKVIKSLIISSKFWSICDSILLGFPQIEYYAEILFVSYSISWLKFDKHDSLYCTNPLCLKPWQDLLVDLYPILKAILSNEYILWPQLNLIMGYFISSQTNLCALTWQVEQLLSFNVSMNPLHRASIFVLFDWETPVRFSWQWRYLHYLRG